MGVLISPQTGGDGVAEDGDGEDDEDSDEGDDEDADVHGDQDGYEEDDECADAEDDHNTFWWCRGTWILERKEIMRKIEYLPLIISSIITLIPGE